MPARAPWLTAALVLLLVALHIVQTTFPAVLEAGALDRAQPWALWRWLTGHLLHTNLQHLAWNGGALLLLGVAIEKFSRLALGAGVVAGMVGLALWFWFVSDLDRYVGLSGILHTLLVVVLALFWVSARSGAERWIVAAVFAGAWVKALLEAASGATFLGAAAWPPEPGSHLAGLVSGCALLPWLWRRGAK